MKRYLLDTAIVTSYLKGRPGILTLVEPWVRAGEATTSMVVYGEVVEYLQGFVSLGYAHYLELLQGFMQQLQPYSLTYAILVRYATIRRALRPPHGPGLIGDIDTLIAATALEHTLSVVTTDSDFKRVPGLTLHLIPRANLK